MTSYHTAHRAVLLLCIRFPITRVRYTLHDAYNNNNNLYDFVVTCYIIMYR